VPTDCRKAAAERRPVSLVDVSKAVSHALRHEPWLYELELDDEGWAAVEALLNALRMKGAAWRHLTADDIEAMIEGSDKKRHELKGDRIRALYGHSLPGRLRRVAAKPPPRLYHGTSPAAVRAIMKDGLRPMGRQYVHLSADVEMATGVGNRKAPNPVILVVDCTAADGHGVIFYEGNDKVWLADFVPGRYVTELGGGPT